MKDHSLLGPTYGPALAWEGRRYQQTYMNLLERTSYRTQVTWRAMKDQLEMVLRDRLQFLVHTLYQIALYCERFYLWQRDALRKVQRATIVCTVTPILRCLQYIRRLLDDLRRIWTKDEDRFEPVQLSTTTTTM